jgi:hypothetical protein
MKRYILFLGLFVFAAQAIFAQIMVEQPDYSTTGNNNVKIFAAHYNQYCGGAPISLEEQEKHYKTRPLIGISLYIYSVDSSNILTRLQNLQTDEKGTAQTRLSVGKYVLSKDSRLDSTPFAIEIPDIYSHYYQSNTENETKQVFFEVENIKKTAIVGYSTATRCPYPDRP